MRDGFPLPRIREDRPRLHEDKLRGNDPPEADRGLGCPKVPLISPKIEDPPQEEWGPRGLKARLETPTKRSHSL